MKVITSLSGMFVEVYGASVDVKRLNEAINNCLAQEVNDNEKETNTLDAKFKGKLTKNKDNRVITFALKGLRRAETSKGKLPMPLQVLVHDIQSVKMVEYVGDYSPLPPILLEYCESRYAKKSAEVTEKVA